jgi:Fic family protein
MDSALQKRLDELSALRGQLADGVGARTRWMGPLRREVRASAIGGSTSIEGFSVSPEEALALTSGREVAEGDDENRQAVACYAQAMDHVGTMAIDPSFRWLDRVILDLHFEACHFQRDKDPGLWRTGPIGVTGADGSLEYRGPDGEQVVGLMSEVIDWLATGDLDAHVTVRAAMAHLHVTSVHPFRDGNGRISRIVQSLVLAREGLTAPEFFSIEEYLGAHTREYYAALRKVQAGSYQHERDASSWVAFCLKAHITQAKQRLTQIERAAERWQALERIVDERGWPDRIAIALEQSLHGTTDRRRYGTEADVSAATASGDLRRLLDAGLIVARGRGRTISYAASDSLRSAIGRSAGSN